MKTDLISSIGVAIIGVLLAFFICNLFIGEIKDYEFQSIDASINADLIDPNPEVFNYKALNPTVEVYVGNCTDYNSVGECIEESTEPTQEEE